MLKIVKVTKAQFACVVSKPYGLSGMRIETLPCQNIYLLAQNTIVVCEDYVELREMLPQYGMQGDSSIAISNLDRQSRKME